MDAIGWRPDPEDVAFERWWDGVAWTSQTRPARDAEPEAQGPRGSACVGRFSGNR